MKKILTLLIAIGAIATVQAQSSREEARRVILGNPNNEDHRPSDRSRDVVLGGSRNDRSYPDNYPSRGRSAADDVNREYDAKVYSIQNNRTLSRQEKERMIRQLEEDRNRRLRELNGSRRNGPDCGHHDNGKHKGHGKRH